MTDNRANLSELIDNFLHYIYIPEGTPFFQKWDIFEFVKRKCNLVNQIRNEVIYGNLNVQGLTLIQMKLQETLDWRARDISQYEEYRSAGKLLISDEGYEAKMKADNLYIRELKSAIQDVDSLIEDILPSDDKNKQKGTTQKETLATVKLKDAKILNAIHKDLKSYFVGNEALLRNVFSGQQISNALTFNGTQAQLVELVKRMNYNNVFAIKYSNKTLRSWLCSNFKCVFIKGNVSEVRNLNANTVTEILTKPIKEPANRILLITQLPFKVADKR